MNENINKPETQIELHNFSKNENDKIKNNEIECSKNPKKLEKKLKKSGINEKIGIIVEVKD